MSQLTTPRGIGRLVERNLMIYRRVWLLPLSSIIEPAFYLLSIGIGVGALVGDVEVGGQAISYQQFVAPALLASAAMQAAVAETTYNFLGRLRHNQTYDAILATPLRPRDVAWGEAVSATMRGGASSLFFVLAMTVFGLMPSWWGVLALPVAVLVGFTFAAVGLAATSFVRAFHQLDNVYLVVMASFLLSATFFPLERYPGAAAVAIQCTPLYQGVELSRSVILGDVHFGLLWHVAYLVVLSWVGVQVATRRLAKLLLP